MIRANFHTHTVFCDGADTPEELVCFAIGQECDAIGFSGHSHTEIPEDACCCMTKEAAVQYQEEVRRLKEKYRDRIRIYLGIEQDYYSTEDTGAYEYVIGSVHYLYKNGAWLPVDESEETLLRVVEQYYGGDYYAFAEDYFALEADVVRKTNCDIVGHFDLITKFNEGDRLFRTDDPRYVRAADRALEQLLQTDAVFEVNSGAIARGYRTAPYPQERLLRKILDAGKQVLYTSDCHNKEQLLFGLPEQGQDVWLPFLQKRDEIAQPEAQRCRAADMPEQKKKI